MSGPVVRRIEQISPADVADACRVLHAIQQVSDHQELPHLVIVDPVELALDPGMYALIAATLTYIDGRLYPYPSIEWSVTFRVPANRAGLELGDLAGLLVASLPAEFRQWVENGRANVEPIFDPVGDQS